MAIKLGPCQQCGKRGCSWRSGLWAKVWMTHDPESYLDWSRYTSREEAPAGRSRFRRFLRRK